MSTHPSFLVQLGRCQPILATVTVEYLRRVARKAFGRREARRVGLTGEGEALVLVVWSFATVAEHMDEVTEVLGTRPDYTHDALAHGVLSAVASPHAALAPEARRMAAALWSSVARGAPDPATVRELLGRGLIGLPDRPGSVSLLEAGSTEVWTTIAAKAPTVPKVLERLADDVRTRREGPRPQVPGPPSPSGTSER